MSAQLSKDDLQFLALFNRNPDGERLKLIIKKKLESVILDCINKEAPHVYRSQGQATALNELLSDITNAEEKLNRSTHYSIHGREIVK